MLSKFKTLERVEFSQNGIKPEDFPELFKSFKENPKLRIINLEDNTIKSSIKELIEALPLLKNLQTLNLNDCLLGHENSIKLFQALKDHENLKIIKCSYNEIEEPEAQKEIFNLILENKEKLKNLKKLELKGNEIDKDVYKKYNKNISNIVEEFIAYSDEELEADLYEETEEDEFGNLRKMENLKIK